MTAEMAALKLMTKINSAELDKEQDAIKLCNIISTQTKCLFNHYDVDDPVQLVNLWQKEYPMDLTAEEVAFAFLSAEYQTKRSRMYVLLDYDLLSLAEARNFAADSAQ